MRATRRGGDAQAPSNGEPPPGAQGQGIRHPAWVLLYGVAMGYLEAAVVVYLRGIYYAHGFDFPLVPLTAAHAWTELGREAATLVMLAAVAVLAGTDRWRRLLAFLILFGVWDLAYYGGLWVLEAWPRTLVDWDILFLIPVAWFGPVWAPMGVAVSMVLLGAGLVPFPLRPGALRGLRLAGILLGGVLLLLSFTLESWLQLLEGDAAFVAQPGLAFPWWLYFPGLVLVWAAALRLRVHCRAGSAPR